MHTTRRIPTRNSDGNLLILLFAFTFAILVPAFGILYIVRAINLNLTQGSAVEAAALSAATELSKVVIEDPYYGYISFIDHTSCGRATLAADGQPLPVTGINSAIASARFDLLLAKELGDNQFQALAQLEANEARRAARNLTQKLATAITPKSNTKLYDLDGKLISPYSEAKKILEKNLLDSAHGIPIKATEFTIDLGWLTDGCETSIPVPQPFTLSGLTAEQVIDGEYKAFVDVPVGDQSLSFVGISKQPRLADPKLFQQADATATRFSSVVRVTANIPIYLAGNSSSNLSENLISRLSACAIPGGQNTVDPPGALVMNFPHGLPKHLDCLKALMSMPQLNSHTMDLFSSTEGDYPLDSEASLKVACTRTGEFRPTVAEVCCQTLFDWIRTGHGRLRLDSLLNGLNQELEHVTNFSSRGELNSYLVFEFDSSGHLVTNSVRSLPFNYHTVQDQQLFATASKALEVDGASWMVTCYDHVANQNIAAKHAGQVLQGNPINWCELPEYGGSPERAVVLAKGGKHLHLQIGGPANLNSSYGGIDTEHAKLFGENGKEVLVRKSLYSGGLASYIELSMGTRDY
jgi:hypothetical protein